LICSRTEPRYTHREHARSQERGGHLVSWR
jgi:hypothetical protein